MRAKIFAGKKILMEEVSQKRKFSQFIEEEELGGSGERFSILSKEIYDKGLQKCVPVKSIEVNQYRPVTKEGLDRIEASMKYHHSEKYDTGQVLSATARVFLCQSKNRGKFVVLDGNHRVSYWKSKGWSSIPAIVINKSYSEEDIEIFAENQNLLSELFSKQRSSLQILNRTIVLKKKNIKKSGTELISENKSLFLRKDVGKKYLTLANLCIKKKIEPELLNLEKNEFTTDFSISKVLSHKCTELEKLDKVALIEVFIYANNPDSTISELFYFCLVIHINNNNKQKKRRNLFLTS